MKMKLLIAGFLASSLLSASASASEVVNCSSLDKDGFANATGSCTLSIGATKDSNSITVNHCVQCQYDNSDTKILMVDIEKATQAYEAYCEAGRTDPGCDKGKPNISDPRFYPFVYVDNTWRIEPTDGAKTCKVSSDIGDRDTALACHIVDI